MIDHQRNRRLSRQCPSRPWHLRLSFDPPAPAPSEPREPMPLSELLARLPAREGRLLTLIMRHGWDQAEACDQLARLVEGRGCVP